MHTNVGQLDRLIRAAFGLALLWFAFLSGMPAADIAVVKYGASVVGVVMLLVAAVRVCPIYSVFGLRTCPA